MAANVMTEAILIIASVIIATTVAGVVMSQVGSFQSTFTATSDAQKNEMLTKLKIIYAVRNATGTPPTLEVWVKNIGIDPIVAPASIDVYYGNITAVQRIPYNANGGEDTWRYNSLPTVIQKMDTVQIKITDTQLVANKTYFVRITAPNGVYADYVIST